MPWLIPPIRVIFSDTDALTTCIWSEWLYKEVPEELLALAQRQKHDLYLLLDVDVPWIEDPQRYYPEERETFLASCKTVPGALAETIPGHKRQLRRKTGEVHTAR
ncbi:MAG: ATP-binding protein [Candidatus Competibacteraceae bacterium]|nr:ATP-binding protein [Candidatus Competibacteraceae bacterium]